MGCALSQAAAPGSRGTASLIRPGHHVAGEASLFALSFIKVARG